MIGFFIGLGVGMVLTGFVAHRWPGFFAKQVAAGAEVVNQGIDKAKGQ